MIQTSVEVLRPSKPARYLQRKRERLSRAEDHASKGKRRMSSAATLKTVDPDELLDHPFSVSIYGQDLDEAFVESIRRRGIEQPIIVAADGKTVVAGHRRRNAAKLVGLKKVPVVIRPDLKEDLEIRHAIIEANRQRVKTPEQ